jgi:hypothetical protein
MTRHESLLYQVIDELPIPYAGGHDAAHQRDEVDDRLLIRR